VPADASALYARNVLDFLKLIVDKEGAPGHPDRDDDIVSRLPDDAGRRSETEGLMPWTLVSPPSST
jgi:hypothetical protein